MNLALSNIALDDGVTPHTYEQLRKIGLRGIEIAPTKIWGDWQSVTVARAKALKSTFDGIGLEAPSMQALLYNLPELKIFTPSSHKGLYTHFKKLAEIAEALACKVLVFGSPKNRQCGDLSATQSEKISHEVFNKIGDIFSDYGCTLGIEPNPPQYNCDFLSNSTEAHLFVTQLKHPNIQLHLDSGASFLNQEDLVTLLPKVSPICHFHVSEPMLDPIINQSFDQAPAIRALMKLRATNWVSIEMKQPRSFSTVIDSIQFIRSILDEKKI